MGWECGQVESRNAPHSQVAAIEMVLPPASSTRTTDGCMVLSESWAWTSSNDANGTANGLFSGASPSSRLSAREGGALLTWLRVRGVGSLAVDFDCPALLAAAADTVARVAG